MNNDTDCELCSYYMVSCDGKTKYKPVTTTGTVSGISKTLVRCENQRKDLPDREIKAILEQK